MNAVAVSAVPSSPESLQARAIELLARDRWTRERLLDLQRQRLLASRSSSRPSRARTRPRGLGAPRLRNLRYDGDSCASTEVGVIASGSLDHVGLHVCEEAIVEVVDEQGRPVPAGTPGGKLLPRTSSTGSSR
jgi:hypothetical protein